MGAVTVKTIFYVLMIMISGGIFLYTVLAGGLTWMKASCSGILQFHKIFPRVAYWCYYGIMLISLSFSMLNFIHVCSLENEMQENMQYEQTMTESELSPEEETQEYILKIYRYRQNGFFYLFMAMLWFSIIMMGTGFITAKGYYPMGAQKPKEMIIESKEGKLQFYLLPVKIGGVNKPLMELKDTPENRKQFASLFRKRKSVKGKRYAS